MSKISSLYSIGKSYLKDFFCKSSKKAESVVADSVEQAAEKPIRVTSKQIEAYYKRYEQHLVKKNKKVVENTNFAENDLKLIQEINEYNNARFVDVSEDALKTLEKNFEEKKAKVIEIILANPENLSPQYLKFIKNIQTTKDLALVLRTYMPQRMNAMSSKYGAMIKECLKGKSVPLELQQQLYQESSKMCDIQLEIIKSVLNPSTDPEVLRIENYLKTKYGMDFVHLESLEEAKKILKTIDIVKKYNVPMPNNIIITPFTMAYASGENLGHSMIKRSIIIQGQKEKVHNIKKAYKQISSINSNYKKLLKSSEKTYLSTDDPLHVYVHEFLHSAQTIEFLIPFQQKPIPKKFMKVAEELGTYANTSKLDMDIELTTKDILRSLNKEERELSDYLKGKKKKV